MDTMINKDIMYMSHGHKGTGNCLPKRSLLNGYTGPDKELSYPRGLVLVLPRALGCIFLLPKELFEMELSLYKKPVRRMGITWRDIRQ